MIVEIVPNLLTNFLPKIIPMYVKNALINEKIVDDNNMLLFNVPYAIPILKLSILTVNENNRIDIIFVIIFI